jgi:glycosyltransferase involved in cell wall biosynthesis
MIVEDYPPLPGGDGVYVREIGHILVEKGHEVHVITRGPSAGITQEHPRYIVHRVSRGLGLSMDKRFLNLTKFASCLSKLNKENKFDLIHAQGDLPAIAAFLGAKARKTPIVLTVHGTWPQWLLKKTSMAGDVLGAVESMILTQFSYAAIIAVDSYSFSTIKKNQKTKNMFLIPNGVNIKKFSRKPDTKSFAKLLKIAPEKIARAKKILFVGRLIQQKSPEDLIEIFARVSKEVDSVLVIVGDGDMNGRVIERVREHSLKDRVFILPQVSDDDLINLYLCSDVFLLPSLWEGLPLVAIEAMACGTPVVASRVGGVSDVIDEKVGSLVKPGDIPGFQKALLKLLRDNKLHARLARNCVAKSRDYDWKKIAEKTMMVYKRALAEKS